MRKLAFVLSLLFFSGFSTQYSGGSAPLQPSGGSGGRTSSESRGSGYNSGESRYNSGESRYGESRYGESRYESGENSAPSPGRYIPGYTPKSPPSPPSSPPTSPDVAPPECTSGQTKADCSTSCTCANGHWLCVPTCGLLPPPGDGCSYVDAPGPKVYPNCCKVKQCQVCTPGAKKNDCSAVCSCSADGMGWGCVDACPLQQVREGSGCRLVPQKNPVWPNCCPTLVCDQECTISPWQNCVKGETCNNCNMRATCGDGGGWSGVDSCPPFGVGPNCYIANGTGVFPDGCCGKPVCPCDTVKCGNGKTCVVDQNTHAASCVCNSDCPDDGPAVCGSDGKTYQNQCYLTRYNCRQNKNVKVASNGACAPPPAPPSVQECVSGQKFADCDLSCDCVNGAKQNCVSYCPDIVIGPGCTVVPAPVPRVFPNGCCVSQSCAPPPPPPPPVSPPSSYTYSNPAPAPATYGSKNNY